MTKAITTMTALELGNLIKDKKASSPEVVKAYIDAAKKDCGTNAFIEVLEESALEAAARVQEKIDKGEICSPFAGVPVAIKDNICVTEGPTTAASKMLEGFHSGFDAHVIEKLKAAGAVIIGKTNMDEFAMGSTTENSYFGSTQNPWKSNRVPGGSSGGSAAAVAGGLAPYSLGSDTGGSVRQPCGFCNLTGIKPTYGSVSRYGLIAHASSLDQIGTMAQDARDCAVALSIISGRDDRDSTSSLQEPFNICDMMHNDSTGRLDGLKIGLPTSYFEFSGLQSGVKALLLKAADTFRSLGAETREIDLPLLEYAAPTYLTIACAEAASNMARFDGIKYGYHSPSAKTLEEVYSKTRGEGFGDEVKRRIIFGYFVLSSENNADYYRKALKVRGMIKNAYEKALEDCDLLLIPVSPTSAYDMDREAQDPLEMYLGDIYTSSVNLAGLPGAAAPCGFDAEGMPVGMQLVGRAFEDIRILDVIARYQKATDHHLKRVWDEKEGGV